MLDAYRLQKNFHQYADNKRFLNRLNNPFIVPKEQKIAAFLAERLAVETSRILEIGCGEGNNLYFLEKTLPAIMFFGIDFSVEKTNYVKAWSPAMNVVCGDALQLPFHNNSFDMVLCRDLLHHVHWAKDVVVTEALRVTRPGGEVVIFESNGNKILNRIFRQLVPSEKGMKESTPERLQAFVKQFAPTEFHFIEASFLLRACAFILGWPDDFRRFLIIPLYACAALWERAIATLLPKSCWTYMMISLRKTDTF